MSVAYKESSQIQDALRCVGITERLRDTYGVPSAESSAEIMERFGHLVLGITPAISLVTLTERLCHATDRFLGTDGASDLGFSRRKIGVIDRTDLSVDRTPYTPAALP